MKRFMVNGTLALVLVLNSVALQPGTVSAIPPNPIVPNLLGRWVAVVGTFPVTMVFTQQKNRSFFGVVQPGDPIHPPNPIRMNISESGNLSAQAHGPSYMLHGHGQYFEDAFGPMMMLDLTIQDQNGKQSVGTIILVPEDFFQEPEMLNGTPRVIGSEVDDDKAEVSVSFSQSQILARQLIQQQTESAMETGQYWAGWNLNCRIIWDCSTASRSLPLNSHVNRNR